VFHISTPYTFLREGLRLAGTRTRSRVARHIDSTASVQQRHAHRGAPSDNASLGTVQTGFDLSLSLRGIEPETHEGFVKVT